MQAAYERGEEKVKVLDETAMTGVVRRAGCVCHSGSKDTHKIEASGMIVGSLPRL